jgi:excisionase family DNA binding protein
VERLLKVEQAAEYLAVSTALIYQLCASGRLPHVRLGKPGRRGCIRLAAADLEAFLAAQKRQKPEEPAKSAPRREVVLHHLTMPS